MFQRRLRVFAGPNGSGKSSLLEQIPKSVPLGYYINADEIEKLIADVDKIKVRWEKIQEKYFAYILKWYKECDIQET